MADYHGSISKINIEYGVGQVELLSEQHGMFGQKVSNHVGFFECLRAHTLNRPIISSQTWTPIRSRTGVPQVAPTGVPQEWNYGWGGYSGGAHSDSPWNSRPGLPVLERHLSTKGVEKWSHSFASVVWRQQKQTQIFREVPRRVFQRAIRTILLLWEFTLSNRETQHLVQNIEDT